MSRKKIEEMRRKQIQDKMRKIRRSIPRLIIIGVWAIIYIIFSYYVSILLEFDEGFKFAFQVIIPIMMTIAYILPIPYQVNKYFKLKSRILKKVEGIGRRWFEMWSKPDLNIADEIVDRKYNPSWTNIEAVGPAQVKREISYFRSVFPDLEYEIVELNAEEEKVWIHYKGRATHKGEGWGFEPTNKIIEFEGVNILYLGSSWMVIDQWDAFSFYDLFFELGLVPSLGELHEYVPGFKK